jgi:hypothetical protein
LRKKALRTVKSTQGFFTQRVVPKGIDCEAEEKEKAKQNKRTGLILLSVAAVFFIGILIRKVMEPSILSLVN